MSPDEARGILLAAVLCAVVAVVVFESWRAESRRARQRCICGHRLVATYDNGHVQPMDADSKAYYPGGEYNPYQCRACRCRHYIWDGVNR